MTTKEVGILLKVRQEGLSNLQALEQALAATGEDTSVLKGKITALTQELGAVQTAEYASASGAKALAASEAEAAAATAVLAQKGRDATAALEAHFAATRNAATASAAAA